MKLRSLQSLAVALVAASTLSADPSIQPAPSHRADTGVPWQEIITSNNLPAADSVYIAASPDTGDFIAILQRKDRPSFVNPTNLYFLDHNNLENGWRASGSIWMDEIDSIFYADKCFIIAGKKNVYKNNIVSQENIVSSQFDLRFSNNDGSSFWIAQLMDRNNLTWTDQQSIQFIGPKSNFPSPFFNTWDSPVFNLPTSVTASPFGAFVPAASDNFVSINPDAFVLPDPAQAPRYHHGITAVANNGSFYIGVGSDATYYAPCPNENINL